MNRSTPDSVAPLVRLLADPHRRALLVGLMLGVLTWAMASLDGSGQRLPMAILMILAGSAAFVLHALHLKLQRQRLSRQETLRDTCTWLCLIGLALTGAIQALQLLG
jgi:hypothetical protein